MKSFARVTAPAAVAFAVLLSVGCPSGGPGDGTIEFVGARVVPSRGELPVAGQDNIGQLFYVIADEQFCYSDGTAWVLIDLSGPLGQSGPAGQSGLAGADGVGITWKGALASAPSAPGLNWAYYNTADGMAYIWDGDSWEVLCRDGTDAQSLNVQGIVAPGSYLALVHGLDREDLTFTAQFVRDGYIYDYTHYEELFGGGAGVPPTVFQEASTGSKSATTLQNGNVLIAYGGGTPATGKAAIYSPTGNLVAGPTVFESASVMELSAVTLQSGDVLIAYKNSSLAGAFAIYSAAGALVTGPTVFDSEQAQYVSATTLPSGNVLIAYYVNEFVVCSPDGAVLAGPTVFDNSGYNVTNVSATALHNGKALIAYSGRSSYATFAVCGPELRLQRVSSNEVRLWNFSWGETLELLLSVNQ